MENKRKMEISRRRVEKLDAAISEIQEKLAFLKKHGHARGIEAFEIMEEDALAISKEVKAFGGAMSFPQERLVDDIKWEIGIAQVLIDSVA